MAEEFNFFTTASDVVKTFPEEAKGRTAVVTGGNSGIGCETVRALAEAGTANVVLCARNVEAGRRVADEVNSSVKAEVVKVVELDLADLESVKLAAATIKKAHSGIDYLVLNAGVMACPLMRTKQGLEMQFGTNHVGHFLFAKLLLGPVVAAGTEKSPSRIVVVSSIAHMLGSIRLDDLNYEKRWYEAWSAYGQSKLANVLFARQLAKRLREDGQHTVVYCLHPGSISTGLQKYSLFSRLFQGVFLRLPFRGWFAFSTKTLPEGASTTLAACLAPHERWPSGSYLADCQVGKTSSAGDDEDMMEKLWDATETLVKPFT